MRLTTKIVIGIILSLLLLCLTLIIGYSFTDRKYYKMESLGHSIWMPQSDKTGINIEPYRVIVLALELTDSISKYHYNFYHNGSYLFIQPASSIEEQNKLFFPEVLKEFTSITNRHDTLTVKLKMDKVREKFSAREESDKSQRITGRRFIVPVINLKLYLHSSNVHVINRLNDINTNINNLEADSIKIYSSGEISIAGCKANVIEPESKRQLNVFNSSAKVINLDLDQVSNWSIKDCDIEVQNMTGSKRSHNITLTGTEKSKINWAPKNKDAELNIRIKGETATISYQIP